MAYISFSIPIFFDFDFQFVMTIFVGLLLFENLPSTMLLIGLSTQFVHLLLLRTFPYFEATSPSFILSIVLVVVNHYMAFSSFSLGYYSMSEILAYFTLCMWLVPFAFFVSLSANEYVLPTLAESKPLISDGNDVVSNYFSKKNKKYGLLSFFNFAKDSLLPQRVKKSF
ncbi:Protein TEX261 [Nymphon striatum]|nr:Protein TEX261 [Nymphon striatum]